MMQETITHLKNQIAARRQLENELNDINIHEMNPQQINNTLDTVRGYVNDTENRINILTRQSFNILGHICNEVQNLPAAQQQELELKLVDLSSVPDIREEVRYVEQSWRKFKQQGVEFRMEGQDCMQAQNNGVLVTVSSNHQTGNNAFDQAIDLHEKFELANPIPAMEQEPLHASPAIVGYITTLANANLDLSLMYVPLTLRIALTIHIVVKSWKKRQD